MAIHCDAFGREIDPLRAVERERDGAVNGSPAGC